MLNTIKKLFAKYQVMKFYVVLFLVGIIFTVISVIAMKSPKDDLIETEAEIIRINEEYDSDVDTTILSADVCYTVDGKEYTGTVGAASGMKAGDRMTICYRADDPELPMNTGTAKTAIVFLCIGIASILGAVVLFVRSVR